MTSNDKSQNAAVVPKKTPVYLEKDKRGSFAAVLLSGVAIASFVVYYLILGHESRKQNSLQLVIAVSEIIERATVVSMFCY